MAQERRAEAWRYGVAGVISVLAWLGDGGASGSDAGRWVVDLLAGAVAFGALRQRRSHAFVVALLTAALVPASELAMGPAMWALVSLAARRDRPQVVAAGVVGSVVGIFPFAVQPAEHEAATVLSLAGNAVATAALIAWGMHVGARRQFVQDLRDRVARLQAADDLRAEQARLAERTRLAREMHDMLAHRISQVSLHSSTVLYRRDLTAEELRENVGVIQQTASAAMSDLRSILGLLRGSEPGQPLELDYPSYDDLPRLFDEVRSMGVRVDTHDDVAGSPSQTTGRALYRIVQETLTNARRHAPGARVRVYLQGSPATGIDVEVVNPRGFSRPRASTPGFGLIGLRERAELIGGTLDVIRSPEAFRVRGWLPWGD